MTFHTVAEAHKFFAHMIQERSLDHALWRLYASSGRDNLLSDVFLFLQHSEPADIKVFPEVESLAV